MTNDARKLKCPACECEIAIGQDDDPSGLTCPHCQADLSSSALQDPTQIAEEIAPGFRPGQKLGNYVIDNLLGTGGMAVVFRGTQLSLNRPVAIKVLPKHFVKKRVFLERFESEAAALASLNHPNIVSVIDRGVENDTYFIVMEYIQGETLKSRLASVMGLVPAEICDICGQALTGLEYAHQRGVIHRDIKPGNIMINRENVVKLADFGLAHLAKDQGGLDVTHEGQSMGTLKYMAPEQLTSAKRVDGRADIYSFGVCLYEMLTGKLPLGAFKMPSEHNPELDARWDDVVTKSLRMDPAERFASAVEVASAIHEIATTERVTLSEREAREENEIKPEAVAELVACAQCGKVSDASATQCEKCGHALSDIFEQCPKCHTLNRIDLPKCSSCGFDLMPTRLERRCEAEAIQTRAKELAGNKDFDAAMAEVEKLMGFTSREYAAVRTSAQLWIERIKDKKGRRQSQIYEAGARCAAERNFERTLHLWRTLPDRYKDVGEKRKEILVQRDEARAALAEGREFFRKKEFTQALASFEKARKFWPNNKKLADYLIRTRNKIGNRNLKKTYLAEAVKARECGEIMQLRTICRRILALDPEDDTALGMIEEMESGIDFGAQAINPFAAVDFSDVSSSARRKPRGPSRKTIAVTFSLLGLAVLVVVIILVVLAGARSRESQAHALLRSAENYCDAGDLELAEKRIKTILAEHPATAAAEPANELLKSIYKRRDRANIVRNKINAALQEDTPAARRRAYHLAVAAIEDPAVRAVKRDLESTTQHIGNIRNLIADDILAEAAKLEADAHWRKALDLYKQATKEFGITADSFASRFKVVREHVQKTDKFIRQIHEHIQNREWRPAVEACKQALGLIPGDKTALSLLVQIAPKLTPPDGMVYVPAGAYVLPETGHRPKTTATFPYGFFIHKHEITCAQYAKFLAVTHRQPPPGWSEEGAPPEGQHNLPVTAVAWHDAQAYAEWAQLRLPTEEQWESAAAGAQTFSYPWGSAFKSAAILAYAVMPVGSAREDCSPVGCFDMAGNVAEWTATPAISPTPNPQLPTPKSPAPRYLVKGSSWTGPESDRLTPMVPVSQNAGSESVGWVLTANAQQPDVAVASGAGVEIFYLGISGSADFARIYLRVWMPQWGAWAEKQLILQLNQPICFVGRLPVADEEKKTGSDDDAPGKTFVKATLETGCVLVGHQPNEWIESRNPLGIITRYQRTALKRPPPLHIPGGTQTPETTPIQLSDVTRNSACMKGQSDRRYINVGFRCVKEIWEPETGN